MKKTLKETTVKIFYSWQTDVKQNKKTILNGIVEAQKKLQTKNINLAIEQSTSSMTGSPDITTAIYSKIEQCDFFIGDISIVYHNKSKGQCNSNVMVELGYAIKQLGLERIILFFNVNTGQPNLLPFDIRNNRFSSFKNDIKGSTTNIDNIANIVELTITNFDKDRINLQKKLKKTDYVLFEKIVTLISEFDQKRKSPYDCIYDKYCISYKDFNNEQHRGDFEWSFELQDLLQNITQKFSNDILNKIKEEMLYKLKVAQGALNFETNYYNEVNKYEVWSKYYLLAEHPELATSKYGFTGTQKELDDAKNRIDNIISMFNLFIEAFEKLQTVFFELSE